MADLKAAKTRPEDLTTIDALTLVAVGRPGGPQLNDDLYWAARQNLQDAAKRIRQVKFAANGLCRHCGEPLNEV
jgi:hypothetical protein